MVGGRHAANSSLFSLFRKCHARDPSNALYSLAFYKFLRPGVEKRFAEISDFAGCAQEHVPVYVYLAFAPIGASAQREHTLYNDADRQGGPGASSRTSFGKDTIAP